MGREELGGTWHQGHILSLTSSPHSPSCGGCPLVPSHLYHFGPVFSWLSLGLTHPTSAEYLLGYQVAHEGYPLKMLQEMGLEGDSGCVLFQRGDCSSHVRGAWSGAELFFWVEHAMPLRACGAGKSRGRAIPCTTHS
jgi:hypothetical protein